MFFRDSGELMLHGDRCYLRVFIKSEYTSNLPFTLVLYEEQGGPAMSVNNLSIIAEDYAVPISYAKLYGGGHYPRVLTRDAKHCYLTSSNRPHPRKQI